MKNNRLLLNTSLLALLPMTASAAVITWAPSVNLFAGGNNTDFISQNGTFVAGLNGGTTTTSVTIGDATFQATTAANAGATGVTANGVTITSVAADDTGGTTYGDGEFNSIADLQTLLGSGLFNAASLTMSSLTVGQQYEVQLFVNDARGGSNASIRDIEWKVGLDDGAGGTIIAGLADLTNRPFNTNPDPNLLGDFIIGTFTADATGTQSFNLVATRGNQAAQEFDLGDAFTSFNAGQRQINAFQLRAVPEPSSTALVGLAGIALLLRRRK